MEGKIRDALKNLFRERPVFHSEADFQHEFAMKLRDIPGSQRIRVEKSYSLGSQDDEKIALDIYFEINGKKIGIELKYKIRGPFLRWKEEEFNLTSANAHPHNRYFFIKDISRLEKLKASDEIAEGYAIFLTNEYLYYKPSSSKKPSIFGTDFLLIGEDGKNIALSKGALEFHKKPNVELKKKHRLKWEKVSDVCKDKDYDWIENFQYLFVAV
ncbi:MAG: hypothetical protein KAJ18_09815 [Candidatus Omnitrophica bacterium]|nr:hypothetical protein [Candidatus Omnitrophota bacterium]